MGHLRRSEDTARPVHHPGGAPGPQRHALLPGAGRQPRGAPARRLHPDGRSCLPGVQLHPAPHQGCLDHAGDGDRIPGDPAQRSLRGRAADRGHRQRAHSGSATSGGGHGHPHRQAGPLYRRLRDLPRADAAGQPRRRTDNPDLLGDPFYIGHRAAPPGAEDDALVDAFVDGVQEVWPGCLIQWKDFKQQKRSASSTATANGYRPFNDDVQGMAAVVVAGVLAAMRTSTAPFSEQRIRRSAPVGAGIGIARFAAPGDGRRGDESSRYRPGARPDRFPRAGPRPTHRLDESKRSFALPAGFAAELGLELSGTPDLQEVVEQFSPTVLVGTSGVPGTFTESVVRAMAGGLRPSAGGDAAVQPTANTEAHPADVIARTDGRRGSPPGTPSHPVTHDGVVHKVGQADKGFIFPGAGPRGDRGGGDPAE